MKPVSKVLLMDLNMWTPMLVLDYLIYDYYAHGIACDAALPTKADF
jgi:hypothetical protein